MATKDHATLSLTTETIIAGPGLVLIYGLVNEECPHPNKVGNAYKLPECGVLLFIRLRKAMVIVHTTK